MDAPNVEFFYAQTESTQSLSNSSDSEKHVDKRRRSLSANDIASTAITHTPESSSSQDLGAKIREAREVSLGVLNQLETTIKIFADDKKEREANDIKNQEYNLEILQHIQKFRTENEQVTKTNQQLTIDIVSLRDRMNNIEKLYKILNDGLSAAQKTVELQQNQKKTQSPHGKTVTTPAEVLESKQSLNTLLKQVELNSEAYQQTKVDYSSTIEQIHQLEEQIKELEKQFKQLANTVDFNVLFSQIMTSSWFDLTQPQPNQQEENTNAEKLTLKNLLLQHQKKLLALEKTVQELTKLPQPETDYHSMCDTLGQKISALENNNASLMRKVQLYMTGSVAIVIASFWFWWHTHKA